MQAAWGSSRLGAALPSLIGSAHSSHIVPLALNHRHLWDESAIEIRRVEPTSAAEASASASGASTAPPSRGARLSEWAQHRYRSRFPRPMAAREYNYVRRVWPRPTAGGCYAICRACDAPAASSGGPGGSPGGDGFRAVRVGEFVSSFVIRACQDAAAAGGVSTELVGCYFEDSGVRAGLAKMAVPKGLWAYIQKYDAALRCVAAGGGSCGGCGMLSCLGRRGRRLRHACRGERLALQEGETEL